MKTVSSTQPPPECSWTHSYVRGLDPWHRDAFPDEFKPHFEGGPRGSGWFHLDYWGNEIGFTPDGTTFDDKDMTSSENVK